MSRECSTSSVPLPPDRYQRTCTHGRTYLLRRPLLFFSTGTVSLLNTDGFRSPAPSRAVLPVFHTSPRCCYPGEQQGQEERWHCQKTADLRSVPGAAQKRSMHDMITTWTWWSCTGVPNFPGQSLSLPHAKKIHQIFTHLLHILTSERVATTTARSELQRCTHVSLWTPPLDDRVTVARLVPANGSEAGVTVSASSPVFRSSGRVIRQG